MLTSAERLAAHSTAQCRKFYNLYILFEVTRYFLVFGKHRLHKTGVVYFFPLIVKKVRVSSFAFAF